MRKRIGILTGGGDVPGLNAAIKSFVGRLSDDGHEIFGLRRGWASLRNIIPDRQAGNSAWVQAPDRFNTIELKRTAVPILPTRRINPTTSKPEHLPAHLHS